MTGLSYLVHWEGSAPNCLHEEKSLLPDNDESEEEAEDKGYDGNEGDRVEVHTLLLRRVFPTLANFCFNCSRHRWM